MMMESALLLQLSHMEIGYKEKINFGLTNQSKNYQITMDGMRIQKYYSKIFKKVPKLLKALDNAIESLFV
jgi:hypothetical protein